MAVDYVRPPVKMVTQKQNRLFENLVDINSNLKKSSITLVALSDAYVHKYPLPGLPTWIRGDYGRRIIMGEAKEYTSYMSIFLRRLGWYEGARRIQSISFVTMIATMAIENGIYYNEIITNNPSLDEVEDYYDTPWNPIFWIYRRIENELKKIK